MDFVATFLPSDLEWLRDWETLQRQDIPSLDPDGFLMHTVEKRLRWEVATEFGYRTWGNGWALAPSPHRRAREQ